MYVENLNQINNMKRLFILIALFITIFSCSGQELSSGEYYKNCMAERLSGTGVDFYKTMLSAEKYLIQQQALIGSDRMSYVTSFSRLLDDDSLFEFYKDIQKKIPKKFDLGFVAFDLFSLCSDMVIDEVGSNCNCLNVHKNLLKKIYFKQFNDDEILDDLFVFTDFDDDILRMHITYLFLLNMEIKYEEKV